MPFNVRSLIKGTALTLIVYTNAHLHQKGSLAARMWSDIDYNMIWQQNLALT
jgi:hypothetical protein